MTINIAIADEHTLIRRGVQAMILDGAGHASDALLPVCFGISGEAASNGELMALLAQHTTDILLLGSTLIHSVKDMEGLTLVKWLAYNYPTLKILMLSSDTNPLMIRLALEAGASAYLTRNMNETILHQALHAVINGEVFVEHALMNTLFQKGKAANEALSLRETEVLRLICKGMNLTTISRRLHLSIKTVSAHKLRAMEKLNVSNDYHLYYLLTTTRMFDSAI
ncbi:response regulator transcription factor [Enterobacter hormaechei]|jgi:two-component system capsular synthesis response regulator RcsB|uniref:response regulator transcription factor n=1 Tax=Leclercia sp. AS011 TaxID=3081257 RepID=UPI00301B0292